MSDNDPWRIVILGEPVTGLAPKPISAPPKRWRNYWRMLANWSDIGMPEGANFSVVEPTHSSRDVAETAAWRDLVALVAQYHPHASRADLGNFVEYVGAFPVEDDA